jgi:hypothetical protein
MFLLLEELKSDPINGMGIDDRKLRSGEGKVRCVAGRALEVAFPKA